MERDEGKVLRQDLIWSFGGSIVITLLVAVIYHASVQDSLMTGLVFLLGSLIVTFSRGMWKHRKSSRSSDQAMK